MEINHTFIDDVSVLPDLAGRLWDAGYVPSFVTAQKKQDGKIIYKVRLHAEGKTRFNSEPLPRSTYVDTARANPHRGIGVQCPTTRDPEILLCGLDIDAKQLEYQTLIASVVSKPAPTRFGSKGAAIFVSIRRDYNRDALEKVGIDGKNLGPPQAELECMGLVQLQHIVLPPSRYGNEYNVETGEPRYYQWAQFPSRSPAKRISLPLWDVPIHSLPAIDIFHLMEIRLHMHKKTNALAKLILGDPWSGPGDGAFRDRIREAVHFMVMEELPDDYIEMRMEQIALDLLDVQPNSAWGDDCRPLLSDVRDMAKGSRRKPSNPIVGRSGLKVPLERKMEDWLGSIYPEQDVRLFGGEPHYWNSMEWEPLTTANLVRLLYEKFDVATSTQRERAANAYIKRNHLVAPHARPHLIYTLSGVVDALTGKTRMLEKEDFIVHPMQAKYDPAHPCPAWTTHVSNMFRPPRDCEVEPEDYPSEHQAAINTFEEFMGYCMARNYQFQYALFVIGPPNCGKGTLWRVMRKLFPPNSICGFPMSSLDSDDVRYGMIGKLVNIGSEVGRKSQDVDQAFNQITSFEDVQVWKKNSNRYPARLDARLVFDGNSVPATSDVTGAFKRRSLMLRCSAKPADIQVLSNDAYDAILLPELPGILARLVNAYGRLLKRARFAPPQYTERQNEEIRLNANPVARWAEECVTRDDDTFTPNGEAYRHFYGWMEDNGHYKMDNIRWGIKMHELGWETVYAKVDGKKIKGRRIRLTDNFRGDTGARY